jgi:uncharacterized protein (UPF0297 family)
MINKQKGGAVLNNKQFDDAMNIIINALKEKGYDPPDQINGYLIFRDSSYITRNNNAREIIETLDRNMVQDYLNKMCR